MGILSNIANAGLNAYGVSTQKQIAEENLQYQKDFNEQIFAREDNAVQRRARDLEAAGLSKTLAAGSAASAGGSASSLNRSDAYAQNYGRIQMESDLAQQFSSLYLASKDAQIKDAQKAQIEAQTANTLANTISTEYQNKIYGHDWDIYKNNPTILTANQSDYRYQLYGAFKPYLDKGFDYLKNRNSIFQQGINALVDAVSSFFQNKNGIAGHVNELFTQKYGSNPTDSNFNDILNDLSKDVKFQLQYPNIKSTRNDSKNKIQDYYDGLYAQ